MDKELTIGKIVLTDEEVKAKYGEGVSKIEFPLSDGTVGVAYFRKPLRAEMSLYSAKVASDPLGASERLMRSTIIKEISDMRVVEDDDIFYGASVEFDSKVVVVKKSTMKRL